MARIDPHNRVRYWRDSLVPGLALLKADFTRHDYAPHSHDAFVIAVTEIGGSEFKSRGRTEEADTARLLVFNPTEPHSGRMARSHRWCYRSFYLDSQAVAAIAETLGITAPPYFTSNVFGDPDLVSAFLALHRALDEGGDPARQRELLVAGFGKLILRHSFEGKRMPVAPRDRPLLQQVIAIMEMRYSESLTLETLGNSVNLTAFQLIGLFKRTTGMTPHNYLTQIRLRAAIRSIRAGEPLSESAVAAGFYDQAALTTHFKRAYGMTPLHFACAETGRTATARNFGQ